jgi:ribosomal protein S12 methylthiotransferase
LKILFISLGCDKNLADTEMMLGTLVQRGFSITDDEAQAQAVVVNTCCFINDAKQESINTLLEMAELRKSGAVKALIAAGCLAQRYWEEIQKEIPEVDVIVGTTAIDAIADALEEVLAGKPQNYLKDISHMPAVYDHSAEHKRIVTTGGHYAYLKIAEGCDKHCSYCIIPKVRGHYRSIPMEELILEAERLVSFGAKEIILVAQETTLYGMDLYGEKRLPELLKRLCAIAGVYWIRLYCYPEEITDELIETIRTQDKVCSYLDIPIQHASDRILKRMGRRTDRQELTDIITKLREQIPEICLRTTIITGFPGETQEEHESLLEFVDEMAFDRLGVFPYSPEEDTPAALFEDQVDEAVKLERQADIMELQQEIAFEKAQAAVGSTMLVMVEGRLPDEHAYVARSYKDAPNVDGFVFIQTERELMTGDFVRVKITGSYEYDLIGEITGE